MHSTALQKTITIDFHGIVLFSPERLKDYFGGSIEDGTNIYRIMTTTDAGEDVINKGIVIPILGINDSTYEVFARTKESPSAIEDLVSFESGIYPLQVTNQLIIADMASLVEWDEGAGWIDVPIRPGHYAVTVRGFRQIIDHEVKRFGFEFILDKRAEAPAFTADMSRSMQVLELPDLH
jgi:hypothetical protein